MGSPPRNTTVEEEIPITQRSLFSWVLRSNKSLQLLLLSIILGIVFLQVLPLEIQKRIVNDVLSVRDTSLLLIYCLIYLGAVLLSSGLKFAINWLQTKLGQQALTDMRRELYQQILRLPLSFFRETQPGSVVASLVSELATSGNFVGMAVAVPLSNILTLIAFAVYLIWLHPLLGLVTLSIYPIVLFVVPLAQRGANRANKQRVDLSRQMASQITESISGIHEVHAHGSFYGEEKKYNVIIERLLQVRIVWTLYRYGVKVINNLIVGLGPVLVFILGGYLTMQGELELGSMVAFLSAQEKLYDPWKQLIEFYQVYQDASIRYKKVMQSFDEKTEFLLEAGPHPLTEAKGRIEVTGLEFSTNSGIKLIDKINLSIDAGEHVALVGFSGSGKSTLAKCIGQLYSYTGGEVLLDGRPVAELSKAEVSSAFGFISQAPFIFSGSVDDNLLYACRAVGDYATTDTQELPSLDDKIAALQQSGLFIDVLRFGLNTILSDEQRTELENPLLRMRRNFQTTFGEELAEHVEFYREENYLYHSSIAENLIFGTPLDSTFDLKHLPENKLFLRFLDDSGLHGPLLETGKKILHQTVAILGNVPEEDLFFEQTPIQADEYNRCLELAPLLADKQGQLKNDDQHFLLGLALRFTPASHKIIALQPHLEQLILAGRKTFRSVCMEQAAEAV
ncbi:MAG: ABC transporter ATP-binding protein, partial [Thermodesulfobacteriota bacterium]